jgi:hypothetical protein
MEAFLDSAILVDLYRLHPPALAWSRANAQRRMGITSIVWFEMIGGAHDKSDQRAVMRFLAAFELVCLTESDQLRAMKQYEVFLLSHGVGMNDCLIAAPAERLGVPLYTRNLKHFTPLLGDLAVMAYG